MSEGMSFESGIGSESKVGAWGGVTDPVEHDPSAFRYLVHALDPRSKSYALSYIEKVATKGNSFDDRSQGDQSISMYHQPERLAERMYLSMSLIDQDHTATYDNIGLIVEAPEANVILTSVWDAGSFEFSYSLEAIADWGRHYGWKSGDELLREGKDGSAYNEVCAVGRNGNHHLRLKGFFYRTTSAGDPYDDAQANRMRQQGDRLGLPVITIANRLAESDRVAFHNTHNHYRDLGVYFQGSYYYFKGRPRWDNFIVRHENGYECFVSPQEMAGVLDFVRASGSFSEEYLSEIADDHRAVDEDRRRPKAAFDCNGHFESISFHEGYGLDEQRVSLDRRGLAGRTYLARAQSADALSGLEQRVVGNDLIAHIYPLTPSEIATMVEIACGQLDQAQAGQLKRWYRGHRAAIARIGTAARRPHCH